MLFFSRLRPALAKRACQLNKLCSHLTFALLVPFFFARFIFFSTSHLRNHDFEFSPATTALRPGNIGPAVVGWSVGVAVQALQPFQAPVLLLLQRQTKSKISSQVL